MSQPTALKACGHCWCPKRNAPHFRRRNGAGTISTYQCRICRTLVIVASDKSRLNQENAKKRLKPLLGCCCGDYASCFDAMMERDLLYVSWFELSRAYRRLEARGEIRGGYFVNGVSGETSFALPEAVRIIALDPQNANHRCFGRDQ